MLRAIGEDGARGKDWLRARGASPVSYRHNFVVLVLFLSLFHEIILVLSNAYTFC